LDCDWAFCASKGGKGLWYGLMDFGLSLVVVVWVLQWRVFFLLNCDAVAVNLVVDCFGECDLLLVVGSH
jgi:hypothetical protein